MTRAHAPGISAADRTTATPFPPPPEAALITTGSPCSRANAVTCAAFEAGKLMAASSGAPASRAA
jgi:hypothetical protein